MMITGRIYFILLFKIILDAKDLNKKITLNFNRNFMDIINKKFLLFM